MLRFASQRCHIQGYHCPPRLLREAEEDALDRFGDDGTLPQGEVDAPWLRVLGAVCVGFFF